MAKRWRKQKAGQQESKRKSSHSGSGSGGASGSSGTMGAMRGGLKWLVGGGPKPQTFVGKVLDAALWIGVVVVAYVVVSNRCGR